MNRSWNLHSWEREWPKQFLEGYSNLHWSLFHKWKLLIEIHGPYLDPEEEKSSNGDFRSSIVLLRLKMVRKPENRNAARWQNLSRLAFPRMKICLFKKLLPINLCPFVGSSPRGLGLYYTINKSQFNLSKEIYLVTPFSPQDNQEI